MEQTPAAGPGLDPGSAEWLRVLADPGPPREAALARCGEDFDGLLAALRDEAT
ncbi:MAG TPA: hypothetical protein VFQ68_15625 [Streptosporangiaceae bacterium]|nr:hypothetical protein [Streptosporangiaceae bacterium]